RRSGDAFQRHGGGGEVRAGGGDVVGAVEGREGVVEAVGGVGVEGEEGLALGHLVAGAGVEFDAGAGLHRVLLAGAARAEAPGGDADVVGVEAGQDAGGGGLDDVLLAGDGEFGVRVAALGGDHAAPDVHRGAVGQGLRRIGVLQAGRVEHLAGQGEGQFDDVGGAAA